jgi:hypothetical protein
MKYLLLHYVDETAEHDAEVSREGPALLTSWLEDTIARGVNLQGSRRTAGPVGWPGTGGARVAEVALAFTCWCIAAASYRQCG